MAFEGATAVDANLARAQPLAASGATNMELDALARDLKITNYSSCRIKNDLRGQTAAATECGIVNLQNMDQADLHLVNYLNSSTRKLTYSSYSDLVLAGAGRLLMAHASDLDERHPDIGFLENILHLLLHRHSNFTN